ncbi:hypothetical protein [Lapillicoccus jejuensis]|uniref:Uncharacterized protein n=1 Tax=Lapillicoccus jejuensis TaxID=402171 RepID=A0A542DZ69_9MICO|nr:hypothetical protein [Lapillicoccus jejuensis]TQJ08391.1 hypothetical protein FB458_1479 [Lapillicoccus jejuensis]
MPTFCDRCGAPLGADDQRCRTCGWPVSAAPPAGREQGPTEGSTQRLDPTAAPDEVDPGATQQVPAPVADQQTSRSQPVAPAEPASPYVRPSTTAPAEDDPYAGWFVDDQPPARAAAPTQEWTSYDPDESGWQQYDDDPRLPPPLREDERLELDGGARRSGAGRVLAALAVGAVIVLVGLAAIYFGVLRNNGGGSPSAGTAPSTSASAPPGSGASTSPGGSTSSAPSSSATSTSPYPPVSLSGKACGGSGTGPWSKAAAGSTATSCPFALAVQQAWVASNPQAGDSRTVTATSPVTNKSYPMTCAGDQPVTCKGGNGAVVYLYGGTATFG